MKLLSKKKKASGEPPHDASIAMPPVLAVSKVPTLTLTSSLTLQVWRQDTKFFEHQLLLTRKLRDELHALGLWSMLAAVATGTLRLLDLGQWRHQSSGKSCPR